jgi:hypothetical protein
MSYQFTYLYMGLIFSVVWFALFLWRKNTRKEMLSISLLFALPGALADLIYTQDWWVPQTLTGTIVSLEGTIVGFMIGGIATVLYEDIFKKKIRLRRVNDDVKVRQNIHLAILMSILVVVFCVSFYFLKFNSLQATILALSIPTVIIWFIRTDLIIDSIATGILLVGVSFIVYTLLHSLTPGWIEAFWYFRNVPEIIFLNVPLDDIVWYFFTGMFIGPLYEYWKEAKLVDLK